jgi:hypothetical protein
MNKPEIIDRFNSIHGNKFDYSLVTSDNIKRRDKVSIICPIHGKFDQICWKSPFWKRM